MDWQSDANGQGNDRMTLNPTICWSVLGAAAMALGATAGPAAAQSVPADSFTAAFTEEVTFNTPNVTTSSTITSWETQILGTLNGGTLYDQTFALPYADQAVQDGQSAAILAITSAGGPGVIIGTPVLTATSQTVTSSTTTTTYSLADTQTSVRTDILFGPGTVQTGQLTECTGISGLPGTTAPSCGPGSPVTYVVGDDEANFNTVLNTTYLIDQDTVVTQELELFEQYTISGYVQAVGSEHAAAVSAIGEENTRFTRRLLAEIVSGRRSGAGLADFAQSGKGSTTTGWANGFGWTDSGDDDDRSALGLDGGASFDVSESFRVGFGISQGWIDSSGDEGGNADAELTEIGVAAAWRHESLYLGLAGVAGFGEVDSSGFEARADYDTSLVSTAAELGYDIALDGLTLTPFIGGQWVWIETDGFTGKGVAALTSNGSNNDFGEGWIGLMASGTIERVTLSAYGRLVAYSDEDIAVPVSFVGSTARLQVTGGQGSGIGADAGLAASLALTETLSAFADYALRVRSGTLINQGAIGIAASW